MRRGRWCCKGNGACLFALYLAVSTQLILFSQTIAYSTTSATARLSNELGLRLYELLSQKEKGNIVISPLGLTLGLGASRLGATKSATRDMDRIIGWNQRIIHRQLKSLRYRVTIARNDNAHFAVRNLLLGNEKRLHGLRVKFRKAIKFYSARTKFMKSPQVLEYFKKLDDKNNLWQRLVEDDTKTVFVSRAKLDAHWEVPFCVFTRSLFYIPRHYGGEDKAVQTYYMGFLSDENALDYYNDQENKCQVIELNYGNDLVGDDEWEPRYNPAEISMVIVLPHRGHPLNVMEESLTAEKVHNWFSSMRKTNVDVSIPKFNLSRITDVVKLFTNLSSQDLSSGGSKAKNHGTFSEVWQEASLAVSETGTSSEYLPDMFTIALLSKPKITFYAERPFLFLVRDKVTDAILFVGRVVNPNID